MRCKVLAGTNDMKISKKEAMSEVPRKRQARTREIVVPRSPSNLPYASGQGPRDVVPSGAVIVGHVPSEYIASKICATPLVHCGTLHAGTNKSHTEFAVLRVAKLVPTTEISPVPR
jgi:hypothetical protein